MSTQEATLSDRLNPTHPGFDAALKSRWASLPKKERAALVAADHAALAARRTATAAVAVAFPDADEADHAETDVASYRDIAPALDVRAFLGAQV